MGVRPQARLQILQKHASWSQRCLYKDRQQVICLPYIGSGHWQARVPASAATACFMVVYVFWAKCVHDLDSHKSIAGTCGPLAGMQEKPAGA